MVVGRGRRRAADKQERCASLHQVWHTWHDEMRESSQHGGGVGSCWCGGRGSGGGGGALTHDSSPCPRAARHEMDPPPTASSSPLLRQQRRRLRSTPPVNECRHHGNCMPAYPGPAAPLPGSTAASAHAQMASPRRCKVLVLYSPSLQTSCQGPRGHRVKRPTAHAACGRRRRPAPPPRDARVCRCLVRARIR